MNKGSYKLIKTINLINTARKSLHATRKTLHYHQLSFCLVKDIKKNHKEKGRMFGNSTLAISSSSLSEQFFQCRFNWPICLKD